MDARHYNTITRMADLAAAISDNYEFSKVFWTIIAFSWFYEDWETWLGDKTVMEIMIAAKQLTGSDRIRFESCYAKSKQDFTAEKLALMRKVHTVASGKAIELWAAIDS